MILIIGGLGFIGSAIARYLLERGEEVVLTRRRTSRIPAFLSDSLDKTLKVADCDILDLPNVMSVLEKYRVKSILHTAVATMANSSLYQVFKTDMEGTVNVFEAARLMKIKRVSFLSSNTVYRGIKSEVPNSETMAIPLDPRHPIGGAKIAAEALCHLYADQYGLELIITRPSQIYGPYQASSFAPLELMVEGAVKRKTAVLPNVSPDENKDFLYIDDCAAAIGMLHLAKGPKHRVYNVGSGTNYTWGDAAKLIMKLIPGSQIELAGKRPSSGYSGKVDISRLREEFGYHPNIDLEEGLRRYIDWVAGKK